MIATDEEEPRGLGPVLLVAIIAVPGVFCWLLLRKGYSSSLRWAAFTYAAVMATIGIVGQLGR